MATVTASGDSVERSQSKSPDSNVEDLIDDATSHLEKISDYKTYCKVRQFTFIHSQDKDR